VEKTVSVIVSKCRWDGNAYHAYARISEEQVESVLAGLSKGIAKRAKGLSVIVRPNFNNDDGSFEEFRSFDGGQFYRVCWEGRQRQGLSLT
jgi:hypothetical protein